MVMNTGQYFDEAFGDAVQVLKGQLAVVQLTVREDLVYQMLDQSLDSGWCWIFKGAGSRFHYIGQHDQSRLFGLRSGPRIAEVVFLNGIGAFELLRFNEEIADQTGAVMLLDGVNNHLAQLVLFGYLNAVFDMGDQNQTGHGRCQFVMFVSTTGLVFDKIERFSHLTDIVVVAAYLGPQRVGADFSRRRLN
jgi:hypothetical protein